VKTRGWLGLPRHFLLRFIELKCCDEQLQFVLREIVRAPYGKSGRPRWKAVYSSISSLSVSNISVCDFDI
jgi:hypothetical protein